MNRRVTLIVGATAVAAFAAGIAVGAVPQTHLIKGLEYLKYAKAEVTRGENDIGGHRTNAVRLIADAIQSVEKAIAAGSK